MRIVLIGTGNVATILGRKMILADHEIAQVFGRNDEHARQLAAILRTSYTADANQLTRDADLYIIAVTDDAIAKIASQIHLQNKLVVHTAGSVSKDVLKPASKNYGSLYPVQSLRKEMVDLPEIAFLVDGNTNDDLTFIFDFAQTLSTSVWVANDQQRLHIHLAAVIVSNFTNHLYAMAESYCRKEKADFRMLLPIIREISDRLSQYSPTQMQTGPAFRHDSITIQKHLSLLEKYPEIKNLYTHFTKSIQDFYDK